MLREELIKQTKLGKGDFATLLDIFKNSPFGIRESNIPILLTSILQKDWK